MMRRAQPAPTRRGHTNPRRTHLALGRRRVCRSNDDLAGGPPRGSWSCPGRRRCDDELGNGIEGDLRGAADNEVSTFPGPLAGHERYLLGHPVAVVPRGQRPAWLPHASQAAALGLPLIGLDPDSRVRKAGGFAASRPDALNDEQGAAGWDLDRPRALALVPLRRAEGHRLPGARWKQNAVNQQVGPPKPGAPP